MKITHRKPSRKIQLKLLEFFVAEVTARTESDLLGIHSNTGALFYHKIRLVIEYHLDLEANAVFDGEIELDKNYFGDTHKGRRGHNASDKTTVFGLLRRSDRVYVVIMKDTKQTTLMPIITSKIKPDSNVYTNSYKSTMLLMSAILHILESIIPKNLQTITSIG